MSPATKPQFSTALTLLNLCRTHEAEIQQVITELTAQGIVCNKEQLYDPKNLLVLFDEYPPQAALRNILQQHNPNTCQILALDLSGTKLPFYQVWEWLSLGIQEVYSLTETTDLSGGLAGRLQRRMLIEKILVSDRIKKTALGDSPAWHQLLRQVIEVAGFSQSSVLLLGESGTGKELMARLVHDLDHRPDKRDLILLDCTTIVPELSGSEFFGHEKGSFTNAVSLREGAFGLADGGTLFLDEIGELPLYLQAGLLRVIQEGTYKRVGSNQWRKTNFRLVCATNRNLQKEVEQGRFRQDLYYRIATNVCTLPPLRERREDIPELAAHFLQEALQGKVSPVIDSHLRSFLLTHPYPGNVRELRQLMYRLALRYPGEGALTLGCLSPDDRKILPDPHSWIEKDLKNALRMGLANGVSLKEMKRIAAETAMDLAIEEADANLQVAAKKLDISARVVQLYQAAKRNGTAGAEE